jgi:hypothetical protein
VRNVSAKVIAAPMARKQQVVPVSGIPHCLGSPEKSSVWVVQNGSSQSSEALVSNTTSSTISLRLVSSVRAQAGYLIRRLNSLGEGREAKSIREPNSELSHIRDLLDDWDHYEPIYHPDLRSRWPSISCQLIRYCGDHHSVLGQETAPHKPDPLLSTISSIRQLIHTKMASH